MHLVEGRDGFALGLDYDLATRFLCGYHTHMKAVQVMFEEEFLDRLDADQEVQAEGRSAVLRRAAAAYLEGRRRTEIAKQYQQAYGDGRGLGEEFEGWEKQGEWPPE